MTRLILAALEKLGYVVFKRDAARELEQRLRDAEFQAGLLGHHKSKLEVKIRSLEEKIQSLEEKIQSLEEKIQSLQAEIRQLEETRQPELVKRTKLLADKLERQRAELAEHLDACRAQLASGDSTGPVSALGNELRALRIRIKDLETYLETTRHQGARPFL